MIFSNTDRLVSRFLYATFMTSLIHAYVLWKFLFLDTQWQVIIVGEVIGVIAGLLVGLYWIQSMKKRIDGNTLFYSKRFNIILGIGVMILIIFQAPLAFISIFPHYMLPYITLPLTLSICLGTFGVALWAVRYEREHGPLYVKSRN